MGRLVLKFGGTSVGSIQRLEYAASLVEREYQKGNQVLVVVSAMAGFTNQLVNYIHEISSTLLNHHSDLVLSSGEQISAGLMGLALQKKGIDSCAFLGWQIPIQTDSSPTNAKIIDIQTEKLENAFKQNKVIVVAGFQGVSGEGYITTLGRGGSDTTAVALAAALGANRCDIYTDVDGIYTADPRIVPKARRLNTITSAEMFEMAAQGAKVLHARSVEIAMKYKVSLRVLSSFIESEGTTIMYEQPTFESYVISGIAHCNDQAKIILYSGSTQQINKAHLFKLLADADIAVDLVLSHDSAENSFVSFALNQIDVPRLELLLKENQKALEVHNWGVQSKLTKISVVGIGLNSHRHIQATLLHVLDELSVKMLSLTTSEVKLSFLIDEAHLQKTANALHSAFGLDNVVAEAA